MFWFSWIVFYTVQFEYKCSHILVTQSNLLVYQKCKCYLQLCMSVVSDTKSYVKGWKGWNVDELFHIFSHSWLHNLLRLNPGFHLGLSPIYLIGKGNGSSMFTLNCVKKVWAMFKSDALYYLKGGLFLAELEGMAP